MVHVREVNGKPVRFGHTGWLWFNAFLLYDEETGSIWHHLWGRALSGPLRGTTLRRLPSSLQSFAAWRAEHPHTLVLAKPAEEPYGPIDVDVYDRRNEPMSFGLGVDIGSESRYWAFKSFPPGGVIEEEVGGVPVAAVKDPAETTGRVWDRRVGGHPLSFELDTPEAPAGVVPRPVLRERGGRRAWFARSGNPVPGTGAEAPLTPLLASVWEDSAWGMQYNPRNRGAGAVIPASPTSPPASPPPR